MLGVCVFVICPLSVWVLWLRAPSRGQAELVECVRLLDHRRHRDLLRLDTRGGALHTDMTTVVTCTQCPCGLRVPVCVCGPSPPLLCVRGFCRNHRNTPETEDGRWAASSGNAVPAISPAPLSISPSPSCSMVAASSVGACVVLSAGEGEGKGEGCTCSRCWMSSSSVTPSAKTLSSKSRLLSRPGSTLSAVVLSCCGWCGSCGRRGEGDSRAGADVVCGMGIGIGTCTHTHREREREREMCVGAPVSPLVRRHRAAVGWCPPSGTDEHG